MSTFIKTLKQMDNSVKCNSLLCFDIRIAHCLAAFISGRRVLLISTVHFRRLHLIE